MEYAYVYILASKRNGTLYIGVTTNLSRRVWEHKNNVNQSFTSRYGIHTLVWYEGYGDINDAIYRESKLKNWKRLWKLELIEKFNPEWRDLYAELA